MAKSKEEKVPDQSPEEKVDAFIKEVNQAYSGQVAEIGGRFHALEMRRFSSGSPHMDLVLGGGWPFSRVSIIAGTESTGKTVFATKAMANVENYDHHTHRHKDFITDKSKFSRGRAMFIDMEGTFDIDWAKKLGCDTDWHVIVRPEGQEQAIDIVSRAIRENIFDSIVVDSIRAMSPMKEIEESAEDNQVGVAARNNNKAFRKWQASLNRMSQDSPSGGPAVLCLNSFYVKIGCFMGDPREMGGGGWQRLAASIIIYTISPKYDDTKDEEHEHVTLQGTTIKNKTFIPRYKYQQKLYLKDSDKGTKGHFDTIEQLVKFGKEYKIIKVEQNKVTLGSVVVKTQKELKAKLAVSEQLRNLLWRSIIKAAIGVTSV